MAQCQPNQSQHILLPINSLRSDADSQNARGDNGSDQHTINALSVLATLIASVTFQAGVNPPGATTGTMTRYTNPSLLSPNYRDTHKPGKSILANNRISCGVYTVCNTAAFSMSRPIFPGYRETNSLY